MLLRTAAKTKILVMNLSKKSHKSSYLEDISTKPSKRIGLIAIIIGVQNKTCRGANLPIEPISSILENNYTAFQKDLLNW